MAALFLIAPVLAETPEKLDELTTTDGKTYTSVTIRRVDPDGIAIMHAAGTAKLDFERLPEVLREDLGLDERSASEYRSRVRDARAKAEREVITTG